MTKKEESEPMRGRWSASNFPPAGGGGGRDTSSRTFPIRRLHTSHPRLSQHMLPIAFYGGVASPNLIFGLTIAVCTEAKV